MNIKLGYEFFGICFRHTNDVNLQLSEISFSLISLETFCQCVYSTISATPRSAVSDGNFDKEVREMK